MNRDEIEREYVVDDNGRIQSPGKFEGERRYVPYFWSVYLNGFADEDDGDVLTFVVTWADVDMFPELHGRREIRLREDGNGFVSEL